jgi:hypothetical protein
LHVSYVDGVHVLSLLGREVIPLCVGFLFEATEESIYDVSDTGSDGGAKDDEEDDERRGQTGHDEMVV